MAKKRREQPTKQFRPGEREFYEGQAGDDVAQVMEELEALRVVLHLYPQANQSVVRQVTDLPYKPGQPGLDAFIAFKLGRMLEAFAGRCREIGVRDVNDPHAWMQHVDLSAARESQDIDHEAVRQSALNQSGDADGPSTASTDEDVAKSAEVADDQVVRDSLDVRGLDRAIEDIARDDTREMMESLGVGDALDEEEDAGEDDDDEENEDGGGSERIQLDMLDSEGTHADPALCAQRALRFMYRAVVRGYGKVPQGRPGLFARINPLIEHGVLTRKQVLGLIRGLKESSEHVDFSRSIERYDDGH